MKSKSSRFHCRETLARFSAIVLGFTACVMLPRMASAAFGLTDSGGKLTVDTGAGLTFRVNKSNSDIDSIKINGNEIQQQSPWSHVNSGIGATATGQLIGSDRIKITCVGGGFTHYFLARSGQNIIYLATLGGNGSEQRYIFRLQKSKLANGPTPSAVAGGTAIESTDVFLVSGQTRSKFYSNKPMKDDNSHSVSGSAGTVTMWMGNRERSSGGPFFRDIENQGGSVQEVYNYMFSAHYQTEAARNGLHGVYALAINGATPDFGSWLDGMGMSGYLAQSGRGRVNATLSGGNLAGYKNSTAQYWSGAGLSPYMRPGTYTMTLFNGELEVATSSVTVSAGGTTSKSISSTFSFPSFIWRMGSWDGSPSGFMNAGNVTFMHPSDTRMSAWGPKTVSSSSASSFPCYMWKGVNNSSKVTFTLTSGQVANHTIRIGVSAAHAGGRPQIMVNSWTSAAPAAPSQPSQRSLTLGTYRGNNTLYTYAVPGSAFVAGNNTLTITVISGSSGTGFLSPGIALDCIELDN
jgi:rhamnogalacturonan endolyase